MPANIESLLSGRNSAPLTDSEIRRVAATFYGLDRTVPVRYAEGERTRFRVETKVDDENAEVVFGPDIYPGNSLVDDNSALGIVGAAAHECTHYHRWLNKIEVNSPDFAHIDEAITSLEAITRYAKALGDNDIQELVRDAAQRLRLFVGERNRG